MYEKEIREMNHHLTYINELYAEWYMKNNINGTRLSILNALYTEGEQNQKKITEKFLLSKQAVSKELKHMEANGLVILKTDNFDHRSKNIHLTEKGRKYMEENLLPYLKLEEKIVRKLGVHKYREFTGILKSYGEILKGEIEG